MKHIINSLYLILLFPKLKFQKAKKKKKRQPNSLRMKLTGGYNFALWGERNGVGDGEIGEHENQQAKQKGNRQKEEEREQNSENPSQYEKNDVVLLGRFLFLGLRIRRIHEYEKSLLVVRVMVRAPRNQSGGVAGHRWPEPFNRWSEERGEFG